MRRYTPEFRNYILERYHTGEKPSVLEREFGLTEGQVSKWNWHSRHTPQAIANQHNELEMLRLDNQALRALVHRLTR